MNGKETILQEFDFLVSETDLKGNIKFANDDFCRIAEYKREELLGKPHSIVRHEDMPKVAFKDLWDTINKGEVWTGFVKNKTKSNGYYWVFSTIFPYTSSDGSKGYISCRRKASEEDIKEMEELYKTLH